jgi:hypothetical protein
MRQQQPREHLNGATRPSNRAKQKITMARKRTESNETGNNHHLQFPQERIVRLLQGIKSAIGLAEARAVGFEDLEQLSGRPAGTIGSWFEGARMNQLEFLFALLERVPSRLRYELLDGVCRAHPTLKHPKLAHDPIVVSRLESLLKQPAGFSVIHGSPEHARVFLLAALGNSTREVNSGQQSALAMDTHRVSSWAPVPGIIHLSPHADIRQQLQRAWSTIKQANDGSLILLGGVWNRVSHLHSEIVHLAMRCHVIVADEFPKPEDVARGIPGPVHLLTVAPAREQPEWIRVTIQRG